MAPYPRYAENDEEMSIRCRIGPCRSCKVGKYRVCRDGPNLNGAKLREIQEELGISKFGFDGSRITF